MTMKKYVGVIFTKGNSNETVPVSNYDYQQANAGALYVPEGMFVSYNGNSRNIDIANGPDAYGIAGRSPYNFSVDACISAGGWTEQLMIVKAINVGVRFKTGTPTGTIGSPVFVDANGFATLTPIAGQSAVGILMSGVSNDFYDSRNRPVPLAGYIDFKGYAMVAPAAVVVAKTNKNKDEVA